MQLMNLVSSTYFGNIIGAVSLIVGIVGLLMTLFTYRKTKQIEKTLHKAQAEAINISRFNEYRHEIIKALKRDLKAIQRTGKPSKNACMTFMTYCMKIEGYTSIIPQDKVEVQRLRAEVNCIKDDGWDDNGIVKFTEALTGLINILEKGEYDL